MVKSVTVTINNKTQAMAFNIKRLAKFEQYIGKSLFFVMSTGGILKSMDINFTLAGVATALNKELTLDEAAELVQAHCDGGGLLDDINDGIYRAIIASGLFVKNEKASKGGNA
ncbi:MAG: hypothetical protein PHR92_17520 [Lachnospiraceae bacterium]|nr:hypothetical protein [Lachnospiraceae bacterium]